ncbi:hypothetical protein [Streptomyces sp. NBC_01353]|uniref:hypothetical protein n=1 Tax=Streptomyces sp. NBC_01353 TaxID=2903835 RepID=UPI002E2F0AC1|nr:hypothetical protein [Streptomyces sp. NBC_01353]
MTPSTTPAPASAPAPRSRFRAMVLVALTAVTCVTATACSVLPGRDYPTVDPTTVVTRVQARSQWAYDTMGLPAATPVTGGTVSTAHTCYERWAIDKVDLDVASFAFDWSVPAVPADRARAADQRLREAFTKAGWKLTYDRHRQSKGSLSLGFRFEDPATGDKFDLAWHDTTETLFFDSYTTCAQLPEEFLSGSWHSAEWSPRTSA